MNYRINKFFARKSYTADATIVEDINLVDPISSIIIGLESVNSTNVNLGHVSKHFSKIEIIDGSDVLFSLDGLEAEALDWYNQGGKFRPNFNYEIMGATSRHFIGINFGRYLWDRELALDPRKFTNPQIRLTLDFDAGGNTPSAVYITMWAMLFDQRTVSPVGFLMAKELKSWAMSSTVHEYTDLPLDYPYRGIYFRPYYSEVEPSQACTNFKLSEDQDKKIPYDGELYHLINLIAERYPICEEWYNAYIPSTEVTLYVAPSEKVHGVGIKREDTGSTAAFSLSDGDGGTLHAIHSSGACNAWIHVAGYCPHSVVEFPCGMKDDMADWYDVRSLGSLKADITGTTTATGYLFLQQLRSY